jgi:multidrug efflux system membrane fusion protein
VRIFVCKIAGSERDCASIARFACGFCVWRIYQNQQAAKKQSADQAAALIGRPIPVQVTAAEQRPMPIFLTALGTVTPYMSVTVKARVSGELQPVKFTEGQQVRQGETIMVIDPRPYKAALDQAKGTWPTIRRC